MHAFQVLFADKIASTKKACAKARKDMGWPALSMATRAGEGCQMPFPSMRHAKIQLHLLEMTLKYSYTCSK